MVFIESFIKMSFLFMYAVVTKTCKEKYADSVKLHYKNKLIGHGDLFQ